MGLKEIVLETESSALVYKLPTAHLNGLSGLSGAPAHTTQLETVYRQERELMDVVTSRQILLSVSHNSVTAVSNFRTNVVNCRNIKMLFIELFSFG